MRSSIPGYKPGNEWLHFSPEGNQLWEVGQPGGKGRPSLNHVVLKPTNDGYDLFLVKNGGEVTLQARIDPAGVDEINVIPQHGCVTVFKKT